MARTPTFTTGPDPSRNANADFSVFDVAPPPGTPIGSDQGGISPAIATDGRLEYDAEGNPIITPAFAGAAAGVARAHRDAMLAKVSFYESQGYTSDEAFARAMSSAEVVGATDEAYRAIGWLPDPRYPGAYIQPEMYRSQTGQELAYAPTDVTKLRPYSSDAEMQKLLDDAVGQATPAAVGPAKERQAANKVAAQQAARTNAVAALDTYIARLQAVKAPSPVQRQKLVDYQARRKEYATTAPVAAKPAPILTMPTTPRTAAPATRERTVATGVPAAVNSNVWPGSVREPKPTPSLTPLKPLANTKMAPRTK